jgi:hypothetical protein
MSRAAEPMMPLRWIRHRRIAGPTPQHVVRANGHRSEMGATKTLCGVEVGAHSWRRGKPAVEGYMGQVAKRPLVTSSPSADHPVCAECVRRLERHRARVKKSNDAARASLGLAAPGKPEPRSFAARLTTARMLLALFIAQIDEFGAMDEEARRSERGRDLESRIDKLREGRAQWAKRVAKLEAQVKS